MRAPFWDFPCFAWFDNDRRYLSLLDAASLFVRTSCGGSSWNPWSYNCSPHLKDREEQL